jgi:hypothetical protein
MRDKRSALLRDYEEQDGAIKEQMAAVESKLLEICKSLGADSLKTQHGTVMRNVKTYYWTNDWESMHRFIVDNDMPQLLERRISQNTMKQLLEENPDAMPKGVNVDSRYSVTIRRASRG